jgi:hypothetical protein
VGLGEELQAALRAVVDSALLAPRELNRMVAAGAVANARQAARETKQRRVLRDVLEAEHTRPSKSA